MPEIKHQFTGGKMNKDLDERLVPNGEYRDALNIEVSTSEGSDVGTVQNILGNSLIAGQDFIGENAVCIGSIADEKNDKLYYFIAQKELLSNGDFGDEGFGWSVGVDARWSFDNDEATGLDATYSNPYMTSVAPGIVQGRTYRMTYDIVTASSYTGSDGILLSDHTTSDSTLNSDAGSLNVKLIEENKVGTHSISWLQGPSNTGIIKIYNYGSYDGTIDNISVKEADIIVEYDSKTNTITPVLVDMVGDVLKFDTDNIITGINIIDDLLLWTDNENEPKSINIQRSIDGTDASGTVHTNFINTKRATQLEKPIREEHITVIKKAPKVAPTIELISERDPASTYSGVMRITTAPTQPLIPRGSVSGGNNTITNAQNNSSMWLDADSWSNHLHDFSQLKVGNNFDTQIETKLDGTSGFVLDWQAGDTIVFKEFAGDNYDEVPATPITDYSVKAKILISPGPTAANPSATGVNIFTDEITELAQNGDFSIPDANGYGPKHYAGAASNGFTYNPGGNYIEGDNVTQYAKIYSPPSIPFVIGDKYIVSFTLSDAATPLNGGIKIYIVGPVPASGGNPTYWTAPNTTTTGTHTLTIDTAGGGASSSNFTFYAEEFFFQTNNISGVGFTGRIDNISITRQAQNASVRCKVLAINNPPLAPESLGELRFAVDKLDTQEKLFEFKFPRFAYRYQYEDREYSTMSPFSQIAFLPGSFDYHPKKGYNLGMTNRVTKVGIKNFTTSVPDGVVAIDILYKDDSSPNIYVVDTIKPKHNALGGGSNTWDENAFEVTSEQISQMLPSNQLLRLWDNVPRKALAQDISGNRIIYGNYVQGFDLKTNDSKEYYPDFNFSITQNTNTNLYPKKSIKSLREYQLGVVFVDEYGRETPVISNKSGTHKLDKLEAVKINELEISFNNTKYPENMKYFKFFIKETSGEYYNLAMDRYYDAEDGQIWLSFPSSDRNKLDIDTFLILKKGVESSEIVSAAAKYKVLDIQNEAPDFIKHDKQLIEEKTHIFATENIFEDNLTDAPLMGGDFFKMNYDQFEDSSGSNLHEVEDDLYIEFANATNNVSKRYRIAKITTDYIDGDVGADIEEAIYSVKLDKKLGDDVNFITDDDSGLTPTKINDGSIVNIYRYTKENSSKFDGRFFVKITVDSAFNQYVSVPSTIGVKYRTILSKKLYYLSSVNKSLHSSAITGQTHGMYDDTNYTSDGGFGSFAPFFRNYNVPEADVSVSAYNGTNGQGWNSWPGNQQYSSEHVGQYMFGNHNDAKNELSWVTTKSECDLSPSAGYPVGDSGFAGVGGWTPKKADDHDWSDTERDGVFNDEGEQTHGEVWFIDEGPYYGSNSGENLRWSDSSGNRKINPGSTPPLGISGGRMEIAIGGIHHPDWVYGTGQSIPGFFDVGDGGGNPNYDGPGNSSLVSKLYPGQQFRFREDPSGEIYTIQPNIDLARRARFETVLSNNAGSGYAFTWLVGSNTSGGGGTYSWYDTDPTQSTGNFPVAITDFHPGSDGTQWTTQLSPNLTRGWKPRFLNSSGNTTVNWDPTGDPGPIDGGLELAVNCVSSTVNTSSQPYVEVDEVLAVDEVTGLTHSITTGMILTSHSNGGTVYASSYNLGAAGQKNPLAVKEITGAGPFKLYLSGYVMPLVATSIANVAPDHNIFTTSPADGEEMIFQQPKMNGYSQYSVNRINAQHGTTNGGIMAIGYNLEFVEAIESEPIMPSNPAIWETEPKESTDLDIYYEAGGLNPLKLESDTSSITIPNGSTVESGLMEAGTTVNSITLETTDPDNGTGLWSLTLDNDVLVGGSYIIIGDELKITKPNGDVIIVTVTGWDTPTNNRVDALRINPELYGTQTTYILNWHNCFSFGNGVESNRIRDNFNLPFISNGVKVSTTLDEGVGQENRSSGLIYSGIYNSTSSVNNLNQFITAEKITKDINPIYGSIQKIHTRDGDLVTLCEDKCLRILVQKDALFNADGNAQLLAKQGVLGQAIPFSGEFGISKNPESFASESYRVYFTDKIRGTVMRLSKDGLTPISNAGMKDWFKDNLKLSTKLIGSYDDRKDEYNITLADRKYTWIELIVNGNFETDPSDMWFQSGGGHWTWNSVNNNMFSDADPNDRVGQYLPFPVTTGKSYQISYTVGKPASGELDGRLLVTLHDDSTNYKSLPGTSSGSELVTIGTYTKTVTVDTSWAVWSYSGTTNLENSINFHTKASGSSGYFNGTIDNVSVKEIISDPITVSFKEDVRGWVSFKSFVPENGVSTANDYYTMLSGKLYKHHTENANRNNFYGVDYNSSVNVILNESPGTVKTFHTLDYEGSQSKIDQNLQDNDYYNLTGKHGWFVSSVETNKQVGHVNEFIEKEGKWFNYIKGIDSDISSETDLGAFDIQGIGSVISTDAGVNVALSMANINVDFEDEDDDVVEDDVVENSNGTY